MEEQTMFTTTLAKRRPEKALSATFVRNAIEPGWYADGNCLYLQVDDSGSRRWVLRVTIHGRRHDLGLGSAALVTLAEAREEALRLRKIARAGGDPLAERKQEQLARAKDATRPTFKEAVLTLYKAYSGDQIAHDVDQLASESPAKRKKFPPRKAWRSEKHSNQWITSFEKFAFPQLGARRIDQITSEDILRVLTPIWNTIPETARRLSQRLKVVFKWAKASGFRTGDNPAEDITEVLPKLSRKQVHLRALPYADVPAFIQKLRHYEGVSVRLAYEFLILTAARTSEVLDAKWSEIDFEAKTWIVPAIRMKSCSEHRVPLSARSIEILTEAKQLGKDLGTTGEFIFPGNRGLTKPLGDSAFRRVLQVLKYDTITTHGFRSTFRDWCEERTHFPTSAIEAALAHQVRNKVEAAYFRSTLFEKRQTLMESWAQFVTGPSAQVVQMRA